MKKTFLEIRQADQLVASLYAQNPKIEKGKFGYTWKRFNDKNFVPTINELNEKLEDNRIENCLTNPTTKEILYNEKGSYKFSKEGMKNLLEVNRKLLKEYESKSVEIIPFIVKPEDLPELTDEEREILQGLIL